MHKNTRFYALLPLFSIALAISRGRAAIHALECVGKSARLSEAAHVGHFADGVGGILHQELGTTLHLNGGDKHLGRLRRLFLQPPTEGAFAHIHCRGYLRHAALPFGECLIHHGKQLLHKCILMVLRHRLPSLAVLCGGWPYAATFFFCRTYPSVRPPP